MLGFTTGVAGVAWPLVGCGAGGGVGCAAKQEKLVSSAAAKIIFLIFISLDYYLCCKGI